MHTQTHRPGGHFRPVGPFWLAHQSIPNFKFTKIHSFLCIFYWRHPHEVVVPAGPWPLASIEMWPTGSPIWVSRYHWNQFNHFNHLNPIKGTQSPSGLKCLFCFALSLSAEVFLTIPSNYTMLILIILNFHFQCNYIKVIVVSKQLFFKLMGKCECFSASDRLLPGQDYR